MAAKFYKGIDLNNQRAVLMASPSTGTDGVNKDYADGLIRGLSWKEEVVAASTANVSLAAPGTTLDGITLAANDRILLKDQTATAENGIYVWTASGSALTRALDADSGLELSGATTTVQRGTVNADRVYRATADDPLTVGTTSIPWVQIGAGGTSYIAGNGLTLTGSTFDVGAGTGISVAADAVAVDTAVVVRKYAADCVVTTNPQTFTHNLGSDVTVDVWEGATKVYPDVTKAANTATIDIGAAPTAAQYRVVVHG